MTTLFFRNPRLLLLTVALVAVAGLSALQVLPRAEDPELVSRNAVVTARFPGADAELVEALVTEPIEDELDEVEEIELVRSTSRAGVAILRVDLAEEVTETEAVWSLVRDHLADAAAALPAGATEPELDEFTTAASTLVVALRWDGEREPERALLGRLAEELEDELRAVPGTEETERFGAPEEEILVEVDAARLAALGLPVARVSDAVRGADVRTPSGQWRGADRELLIELDGGLDELARIEQVPLATGADGRILRLGEVATVAKTTADPPRELALVDGAPAVIVSATMQSGVRVDHWTAAAEERLSAFATRVPRGVTLDTLFRQDDYTGARLDDLFDNLYLSAALVMLVILLTMGWRSALLVGSALPLSALAVVAGMNLLGIPLHQMSVMGLIIALGLLIDNAIVVVDEVRHHLDAGHGIAGAIDRTVRELFVPLLGSTFTTVLAFLPLVLAPGGVGEFVGAMSVGVILAVTSSFALSMTVVPALAGVLERVAGPARAGGLLKSGFRSPRLGRAWDAALRALFRRPVLAAALAVAPPVLGFVGGSTLQEQFFPPADRDQLGVELILADGASIQETRDTALAARDAMLRHPAVERVQWVVGGSAPRVYYNQVASESDAPHFAQAIVQLSSADDLVDTVNEVQALLDAAFPHARALVRQFEQGPPFDAPVELFLQGPDLDVLARVGEDLRAHLAAVPGVAHTAASLADAVPQLELRVDGERTELVGLARRDLAAALEAALEGRTGGSMIESTEELPVRVRLSDATRGDLEAIASLPIALSTADGDARWTPLSGLGEFELMPVVGSIERRNGARTNAVRGYLHAGVLPADALEGALAALDRDGFDVPPGYALEVGGESAERDDAVGRLMASVSILVVLMVATLVLSFGSFRRAAVIGTVAVWSIGLSLGALYLSGYPFGFMAIVGSMGLIGIAINDSIVVLAAIRGDAAADAGDRDAVRDVVRRSTRHVVSTTLTTVAGFLPLFLGGGSFWPPLAVAIGGGVVGATLLALVYVPAAHLALARLRRPRAVERGAPAAGAAPAPAVPA